MAKKDVSSNGNALPPNYYRVHVNRGPLPPMATLEEMYSKNGVAGLYRGSYMWTKDRSQTGANDVTAEEVVMAAKQFTAEEIRKMGGLTSENVIAHGFRNNLVVADEKETHAFGISLETCDLQRSRWLVGLGSSTVYCGGRGVAVLYSRSGRRILDPLIPVRPPQVALGPLVPRPFKTALGILGTRLSDPVRHAIRNLDSRVGRGFWSCAFYDQ